MDISKWTVDAKMRLPAWCYGRRWWVGVQCYKDNGMVSYGFAEEPFPDAFVLWAVMITCHSPSMTEAMKLTIRVAAQPFVDMDSVKAADRLLKGVGRTGIWMDAYVDPNALSFFGDIRQYCHYPNKRLAVEANGDQVNMYYCDVNVLISSVPKEVPDWVVSGLAGVR